MKKPHPKASQRGFILILVLVTLGVLASIAYMISRQGAINTDATAAEQHTTQARYIAEAGLNHAVWQANASSCTGYADLTAVPLGQHSYSTTVTPSSGSPISIEAIGTHNQGANHTLNRSGKRVYESAINSLIIQPDAAAGKDTFIYEWKSTWNYGLNTNLRVDDVASDSTYLSLLEFDLAGIPTTAIIKSATLELYQNNASANGGAISLHRATTVWSEGTASNGAGEANWNEREAATNWTTAGGDYDTTAVTTTTLSGTVGWSQWDMVALVQGWVDGKYPNQGFILNPAPGASAYFYSSDYTGDVTLRPKLTITYQCECGVGGTASSTSIPVVDDTYMAIGSNGNLQTTNFSTKPEIVIGTHQNTERGLLRFDFTALPSNATVTSATLDLYYKSSGTANDGVIEAYRVTTDWVNSQVTWDEPQPGQTWTGGDYDTTIIASAAVSEALTNTVIPFDITSLVQSWHDSSEANQGLLLAAKSGMTYGMGRFASTDDATASLHPKLTVNYSCPCGAVCGTAPPKTGYYRDEFALPVCDPAIDYTHSDGSLDWSTNAWTEVGEIDDVIDACSGSIKVRQDGAASNYSARLVTSGVSLKRSADLTGFTSAWLSFDARRVMDASSDQFDVAISANGGASWTVLESFTGVVTDTSYQAKSYDISAYISANTMVSFNAVNFASTGGGVHEMHIDNVQIGDPPEPKLQGYFDHFKQRDCVATDYSGSEGSLDWSGYSWTENTETDGSCSGMLQIATDPDVADPTSGSYRLMLDQRGQQIDRLVDLSAFTAAYLSFDFRQYNYPTTSDYFRVRISKNGGANWLVLQQFDGIVSDTEYRSVTYDISAHTASNTVIRFEVAGVNNIQTVYIDNVLVSETPGGEPPLTSPATLNPSADNYIRSGQTTNYGTDTVLQVGRGGGAGRDMHSLLLFDVSGIPAGSLINSATLRLYAASRNGSDSFNLKVHQVTQDWTESGSNWSDADASTAWTAGGGGTYSATVIDSIPAAATGWYEWNIAPLVQEWVENPPISTNQGIELVHSAVAKSNELFFDSNEGANKPELVIDFTPP